MANQASIASTLADLDSNAPLFDQGLMVGNDIEAVNWSQYFPYQLVILEARANKNNPEDGTIYATTPWRFTLPIAPTTLDIDMPVATEVRATLTGIVEQHGGAPFRPINLSGTTGILPTTYLPGLSDKGTAPSRSILATVTAVQGLAAAITGQPANINRAQLSPVQGLDGSIYERSTGYYQFHLLRQFLEAYVAMKSGPVPTKNKDGNALATPYTKIEPKNVRLGFCSWKDGAVYLVSLQNFRMSRTASVALEYQYSLTMKAWKRITLGTAPLPIPAPDRNWLTKAMAVVAQAQAVAVALQNVMSSIAQDIAAVAAAVTDVIRTVLSAIKSIQGAVKMLSDLPATLANECVKALTQDWAALKSQWKGIVSDAGKLIDGVMSSAAMQGQGNPALGPTPQSILDFAAPGIREAFADMLASFTPNQLRLPPAVAAAIRNEGARVAGLTAADFAVMHDTLQAFTDDYTELVGLADPVYARMYNRAPRRATKTADADDFALLASLQDVMGVLDGLAKSAPRATTSASLPNSIDYIAGLAEQSGIAFTTPTSKFAIPFPYGGSLEALALQYLGDANRWMEIAALNGLQAPYVDEEGLSLPLVVNADGLDVIVTDATNLFLGQTVYMAANGSPRQTRHIQAIRTVAPGYVIVTLDGNRTLNAFTVAAQACMQIFYPNTVNSQKSIYIPSQTPGLEAFDSRNIPGVNQFDPLINVAGIALAVDSKLDLIFGPNGRSQIAYGLQNLVQKVKIYLATPLGSILQYPTLGFKMQVGANVGDVNTKELVQQAKRLFGSDPSFSGLRSASAVLQGPSLVLNLDIGLAGLRTTIPVSVTINGG